MRAKKQGLFIVANMAVGATVISTSAVFGHNPIVDVFAFAVHSVVEAGRRAYIAHKYASLPCSRLFIF
jgi:hypothetical protein